MKFNGYNWVLIPPQRPQDEPFTREHWEMHCRIVCRRIILYDYTENILRMKLLCMCYHTTLPRNREYVVHTDYVKATMHHTVNTAMLI